MFGFNLTNVVTNLVWWQSTFCILFYPREKLKQPFNIKDLLKNLRYQLVKWSCKQTENGTLADICFFHRYSIWSYRALCVKQFMAKGRTAI